MRNVKTVVAALAFLSGVVVGGAGAAASAATPPKCAPAQMAVSLGQSNGAAGTIYYPIIFTNTGQTCRIWGVPHIQPVAGARHSPIGPAASNGSMGQMPAIHTLAKGRSVSVGYGVVETGNYTPSTCVARTPTVCWCRCRPSSSRPTSS